MSGLSLLTRFPKTWNDEAVFGGFEDFFRDFHFPTSKLNDRAAPTKLNPAVDINETDKAYMLAVELPGVPKDSVDIELTGNVLTISGHKKSEQTGEDKGYTWKERTFGEFSRSFKLPEDVDATNIAAKFDNGVLTLEVPKSEVKKPTKIEIKTQS